MKWFMRWLACALVICLMGCVPQAEQPVVVDTQADEQAIRDKTVQEIDAIMPDSELDEHLLARLKCDVGEKVYVDGSRATLSVQVTNANLKKACEHAREELASPEQIEALSGFYMNYEDAELEKGILEAIYRNVDAMEETVTTSVDLRFTKQNNVWYMDDNSAREFAKAAYAGLKD